jgi:hypothetical protein
MVLVYTHLGRVSLVTVIVVTVLMFVGIFSRMIPSQALMSAIPEITKRGSFNAASSSVQQLSGGIASVLAGLVIAQSPGGDLQHFDRLGYIVIGTTLLSLALMYFNSESSRGGLSSGTLSPWIISFVGRAASTPALPSSAGAWGEVLRVAPQAKPCAGGSSRQSMADGRPPMCYPPAGRRAEPERRGLCR